MKLDMKIVYDFKFSSLCSIRGPWVD